MKQLEHPNIIQLLGVCTKSHPFLIITEFMPKGKLWDYLRGPGNSVGMETLLHMAQQVCSAMVYLHSLGIIHRYECGMYFFTMSVVMRDFLLGGTTCNTNTQNYVMGIGNTNVPFLFCARTIKFWCQGICMGIAGTRVIESLLAFPDLENFW